MKALHSSLLLLALAFLLESCSPGAVPPVGLLPPPISPSSSSLATPTPPDPQDPIVVVSTPVALVDAPSTPLHVSAPRTSAGAFQSGMALLVYGNDVSYKAEASRLYDTLAYDNVNSILITFPIFMNGYYGTKLFADPKKTPSDAELSWLISNAQSRGFSVVLRPLIDEHTLYGAPPGGWRGGIRPTSVTAWFDSYNALMIHYATLSQSVHAFAFDIGSELDTMERYSLEWPYTIKLIRSHYSGQLTYSFNFETRPQPFAALLDFVSVDAWYNLSNLANPSISQIIAGWQGYGLHDLLYRSALAGKPVVVTEVGAWPNPGIFRAPYGGSTAPYNPQVQQDYYAGTCAALKPKISGIYWWEIELVNPLRPHNLSNFDPLSVPGTNHTISDCYAPAPKPTTNYQSRHYDLANSYTAVPPPSPTPSA